MVGSRGALSLGCPLWAPLSTPLLTFREEHGVQPQAAPALQAGGQLGEVVAVEVEDDLQRLPAALNVVEDVGVCGRTRWGGAGDHPGPGEPCPPSLGQLQTFLRTSGGISLFSPPQRGGLRTPCLLPSRWHPGSPCLPSDLPALPSSRGSLRQPSPPILRRAASDLPFHLFQQVPVPTAQFSDLTPVLPSWGFVSVCLQSLTNVSRTPHLVP